MKIIEEYRCFFKALMYAPRGKNQQYAPLVAGYIILIVGLYFSSLSAFNNGFAAMFAGMFGLLFLSGAMISVCLSSKPNIATLMPISRNKSLAFRFISALALWIIAILFILAVVIVVGLFAMAIVAIVNGGFNASDVSDEVEEEVTYAIGAYGGIFTFVYFLLMYSSSILTGFIKNRKYRNTFTICFPVALFGAMLLTGTPYFVNNTDRKFASPFVNVCYESMKLPWLCILFWVITAVALFGATIYMGIKYYKKSY